MAFFSNPRLEIAFAAFDERSLGHTRTPPNQLHVETQRPLLYGLHTWRQSSSVSGRCFTDDRGLTHFFAFFQ